jgi:hypothetical protein
MDASSVKSAVNYWRQPFRRLSRKPVITGTWEAFTFPDEGNFNAKSIIGPHWFLYFVQPGSDIPLPTYADSSATVQHAHPIKIDRYGNLPDIYINNLYDYEVSIRNEFNVEKHVIGSTQNPTGIAYLSASSSFTTSGNTVVRVQAPLTITLSASPVNEETVKVLNGGSYAVTVDGNGKTISGSSTLAISNAYDLASLQYYEEFAEWIIV